MAEKTVYRLKLVNATNDKISNISLAEKAQAKNVSSKTKNASNDVNKTNENKSKNEITKFKWLSYN